MNQVRSCARIVLKWPNKVLSILGLLCNVEKLYTIYRSKKWYIHNCALPTVNIEIALWTIIISELQLITPTHTSNC